MGLIGTGLGFLFGLPLQWYAVRVIILEEAGFLFPLRIAWGPAGGIALATVGIATLAGLIPAVHAVRLRIAEAIAYE
jgi:putative ABC transport system permease protein